MTTSFANIISSIEIIPNWHAVLVHFPIALLITASALSVGSLFMAKRPLGPVLWQAAQCNLALGVLAAFFALATGWQAFQTVAHDELGHIAMTLHMKWALGTTIVGVLALLATRFTCWHSAQPTFLALGLILLCSTGVAVTGYLGGENVYRNGIGVMRLPDAEHHHHHDHDEDGEDQDHD